MEENRKVVKWKDGSLWVITAEGKTFLVKPDGVTGYGFVREYLRITEKHYRSHLMAADMILQRMLGDRYGYIRKVPNIYQAYLAIVSLSCRYSEECTLSAVCPFNGFHTLNKDKRMVGCNPVYELSLTPSQAKIADMLVNTAYSLSDMAEVLCLSESRVRSLASIVYATMGVDGRQELAILLRGKRIS